MPQNRESHIYLKKANNELVSHCHCAEALITFPPQMDCPWCGCGWLFTCIGCRKAFTFAEAVMVNESWEETGVRDLRNGWKREPSDHDVSQWVGAMKELHTNVQIGQRYVCLDGMFIPTTATTVRFSGWHSRHDLPYVPQMRALLDPAILESLLGSQAYWQRTAVETGGESGMGAENGWRSALSNRWRATTSGPFFDLEAPPPEFLKVFSPDLRAAISEFGGREGFLGKSYLRLYRLDELVALNRAYEIPTYLPEVIVFGSDGGGQGIGLDVRGSTIVTAPFLPLIADCVQVCAQTFTQFIQRAAASGQSLRFDPDAVGKELHDKHPICLGGDPRDPANRVLVPVAKHAELCRYWNKVYCHALGRHRGSVDAGPGNRNADE